MKQVCSDHPGVSDMILVLGDEKKSAIKMPFRVDVSEPLIEKLALILGEDCVVVK